MGKWNEFLKMFSMSNLLIKNTYRLTLLLHLLLLVLLRSECSTWVLSNFVDCCFVQELIFPDAFLFVGYVAILKGPDCLYSSIKMLWASAYLIRIRSSFSPQLLPPHLNEHFQDNIEILLLISDLWFSWFGISSFTVNLS